MDMPEANTLMLLAIAGINVCTAILALLTKIAAEKTEHNTNSMREQLVIATGEAAHAAGRKEMSAELDKTAADIAAGAQRAKETATIVAAATEKVAEATEKVAAETKRIADETRRIVN